MANPGVPQFSLRRTVGQHISHPDDPTKRAMVSSVPISSDDCARAVRQPANANARTHEILDNILLEMKLLNARFEEAFDTAINKGDVK